MARLRKLGLTLATVGVLAGLAWGLGGAQPIVQRFEVPPDFRSIQEAIDAARPGATILVRPGTYYENLLIDKPLTLMGLGTEAEEVLIDGSAGCRGGRAAISITARQVWLENLAVTGCAIGVGVRGAALLVGVILQGNAISLEAWDGSQVTLERVSISNSTVGVEVWALGRASLRQVTIQSSGIGVKVLRGAYAEIRESTLQNNGLGVEIWDAEQVLIDNATIAANQGDGLWVRGAAGAVVSVRESVITDSGGNGLRLGAAPHRPDAFQIELSGNQIERNRGCGVWIDVDEAIEVRGRDNRLEDNRAGDLCPVSFAWPQGFRR